MRGLRTVRPPLQEVARVRFGLFREASLVRIAGKRVVPGVPEDVRGEGPRTADRFTELTHYLGEAGRGQRAAASHVHEQEWVGYSVRNSRANVEHVAFGQILETFEWKRTPVGLHRGLSSSGIVAGVRPPDDARLASTDVYFLKANTENFPVPLTELEKPANQKLVPHPRVAVFPRVALCVRVDDCSNASKELERKPFSSSMPIADVRDAPFEARRKVVAGAHVCAMDGGLLDQLPSASPRAPVEELMNVEEATSGAIKGNRWRRTPDRGANALQGSWTGRTGARRECGPYDLAQWSVRRIREPIQFPEVQELS